MPKKSSARKSTSPLNGVATLVVVIAILALGGYYALSGSDPLGLFGEKPTQAAGDSLPPGLEPMETSSGDNVPFSGTDNTWWDAYFVAPLSLKESEELAFRSKIPTQNYQNSIAQKLIENIDNAKQSIHIASFEFDLTDVANALIRAKQRGVDVRWVTDDEHGIEADTEPGHGQFKALKAAGIQIVDDGRSALMHNKFWLFDGQIVWTGSTNVTVSGMFEQNNNVIVIHSTRLAAVYEKQFHEMWGGSFNARSPSTVKEQAVNVNGVPIQVLFSPEDKAISQIIPYIQKATSSIKFMAFSFTNDGLGAAMIERKKNGVDVQGVFETTGSDSEFGQMTPLYCAKAAVRRDGNPAFLHHKVIIVDKHIVITGSLNFSDNADQSNNENVIIIDNPEIATQYIQDFDRVWSIARDPDPAKTTCN